ncbi:MAG: M20/M25/M40 family metallo-hydrolase [Planctomycetes bacterium]|nr:M20/M25/M40 family metallo-hydrolase [Planctomycetota bacterium]
MGDMLAALAVLALSPAPQDPVAVPVPRADPARLEQSVRALVGFGTRHVLSATDDPDRGTGAARAWLRARFEELIGPSGGRLQVAELRARVPVQRRGMPAEVEVVDVIATLPGTSDPERVYVLSGHYDSRNADGADGSRDAPGANDDGSGTAAVLEVCRLLCGREFPATLVFAAYDGEEQGLLGSKLHADALAAAGAQVDGMITNDIVGNTLGMDGVRRDGQVRVFSYAPRGDDSLGRSLARAAVHAARRVDGLDVKLVFRGDRYGRGGDHRPFFDAGFPAVRFTEPREDFSRQHQDVTTRDGAPYGDLPDFMDFDYLARVATLDAELLAELASAPRAPQVVRVRGARDAYDTVVALAAIDGAAAYDVLWRDTTAPDWEGALRVAAADLAFRGRAQTAELTLPGVCVDDVVIGVRSVAAGGACSRATAAPEPDLAPAGGR